MWILKYYNIFLSLVLLDDDDSNSEFNDATSTATADVDDNEQNNWESSDNDSDDEDYDEQTTDPHANFVTLWFSLPTTTKTKRQTVNRNDAELIVKLDYFILIEWVLVNISYDICFCAHSCRLNHVLISLRQTLYMHYAIFKYFFCIVVGF